MYFFNTNGRSSTFQLRRKEKSFMITTLGGLAANRGIGSTPKRTHETAPMLQPKNPKLGGCVTKSPLVKHKIILYSFRHLLHGLEFVFKNTSVPLFPQVPHNVYHQTVEIPQLILVHSLCCLLPPNTNAIKICRIGLLGERPVLPR